jgi:hypothetical protein
MHKNGLKSINMVHKSRDKRMYLPRASNKKNLISMYNCNDLLNFIGLSKH